MEGKANLHVGSREGYNGTKKSVIVSSNNSGKKKKKISWDGAIICLCWVSGWWELIENERSSTKLWRLYSHNIPLPYCPYQSPLPGSSSEIPLQEALAKETATYVLLIKSSRNTSTGEFNDDSGAHRHRSRL